VTKSDIGPPLVQSIHVKSVVLLSVNVPRGGAERVPPTAPAPAAILTAVGVDDYTTVLYRQDGGWVAEIPALSGCYALMPTRDEALAELRQVFALIVDEYREKGLEMPADTTEIVNA